MLIFRNLRWAPAMIAAVAFAVLATTRSEAQYPSVSSIVNSALGQTSEDGEEADDNGTTSDSEDESETGIADGERIGTRRPATSAPQIEELDLVELQAAVAQLQQTVAAHTSLIQNQTAIAGDLAKQISENREQIANNIGNLESILEQQQRILDSISRQDSQGQFLPRLDANMANPEFAEEFRTAIKKAQPTTGTLVIRNTLPYDQAIIVNGEQHTVVAQAYLTIRLPVGNVETRIPGGQNVNWFIGAPEFTQRIRLAE